MDTAYDPFIDGPKTNSVQKKTHDVFIDGPIKSSEDNSGHDVFIDGEIPKTNTEKEVPSLAEGLKTSGAKFLGKTIDAFNASQNVLKTEGERALLERVDIKNEESDIFQTLQKKVAGIDLVKFLTTPTGMYMANIGMRTPMPSDIINEVVPEKFMLPENDFAAYPPWIAGFFKATGAEPNKIVSKLSQAVAIDSFSMAGFNSIAETIMPAIKGAKMSIEAENAVKATLTDIKKLSPEGLDIYNRELKNIAKPKSEVDALVEAEKKNLINQNKLNKLHSEADYEPTIEDLELYKKHVKPTELQIQDEKVNLMPNRIQVGNTLVHADETGIQYVKNADYVDEFSELKKSSLIENDPDFLINKAETIKDIFPKPMKADIDYNFFQSAKGAFGAFRSPYLHFRPAFDVALEAESHADMVHKVANSFIDPFKNLFDKPQVEAIAAIVDHSPGHDVVLKNMETIFGEKQDMAIKAVDAFRQGWKKLADIKGIPESGRLDFYMTHIMMPEILEYQKLHNMDISPELSTYAKVFDKYLQERKGLPGFSMDIFSNYKEYTNWVAHSTTYDKYYQPFLSAVKDIHLLDTKKGEAALEYMRNFFGLYGKESANYRDQMVVANSIGKTMSDALIANNPATWAVNLTQGPYFGAAEIGYYRYSKGVALASLSDKTEEGAKWAKRWQESGFSTNHNKEYITSSTSLTDMGLRKLGMSHETISKIDAFSYGGMQWTETMNKKPVYFGAFDKAESMIKKVKEDGIGKHKYFEQWIKSNGIDISKDTEEESRRYARFITAKTQQDYGRSGRMIIQNNPIGAALMRVANFPIRAGELITENAYKSAKYLAQAGFGGTTSNFTQFVSGDKTKIADRMFAALMMPELHATFRFGLATASMMGLAKVTGTSWKKITGTDNFMIKSIPLLSVAKRIGDAITAFEQHDPQRHKKVAQAAMLGIGFKFAAPINKIIKIIEVADDNKYATDKDWTIKWGNPSDPKSKVIGKQNPMGFILSQVSPIQFKSADEYASYLKQKADIDKKISNYEAQARIAGKDREYKDAQKAKQLASEERHRKNILRRVFIKDHPDARIQ